MIIMIIVTALLFIALYAFLGLSYAFVISPIFFIGWFIFNVYSNRTGLIKAIWSRYYFGIKNGLSHEDAIKGVIYARSMFDKTKALKAYKAFMEKKQRYSQLKSDDPFDLSNFRSKPIEYSGTPEINDLYLVAIVMYIMETDDWRLSGFNYKAAKLFERNYRQYIIK